jgi:hypothetical protein
VRKKASITVQKMKDDDIYPYYDLPKTEIEFEERNIFDVCLLQIASSSEKFDKDSTESKKILVNLLKDAIERDVRSVIPIFQEVLKLPDADIENLKTLIEQYSLPHIIKLSKIVADKLAFIAEL